MFLESHRTGAQKKGSIEVICGSMFSGKTEELIRRLKRAQFAKQKVEIFKPKIDTRYHEQDVVSHDANAIRSTPVPSSSNILLMANDVCNKLANNGVRVIIAGLDMDFAGNPFGPVPQLMAVAEHVTKVHAICMDCGAIANHSYRKSAEKSLVMLGETDSYVPLCRECFNKSFLTAE